MRLPPNARRADSPPVEPPGEYLSLCGLVQRPQTSFVDSKERRVVGRLVLTKGTAPKRLANVTPTTTIELTSFLQQPHHRPILGIRLSTVAREPHGDIKARDLYRVLQRHGYSRQWALQIDLVFRPCLSFREQYLRHTVCLLLCLYCYLAVCAQDIDGTGDLLVHILDELLDWLAEDGAFLRRKGVEVWLWEGCNLGGAFGLLALAAIRLARVWRERGGHLPVASVLPVC